MTGPDEQRARDEMRQPDVLLINPPWIRGLGNIWRDIGSCSPPLGLAYLAAYVRREGYLPAILDMEAERLVPQQLAERLQSVTPRYVGISVNTSTYKASKTLVQNLRQLFPSAPIIVGGVHPSILPEPSLDDLGVDLVVKGEGERPLAMVLAGHAPESIPGVTVKIGSTFCTTAPPPFFPDLDTLPPPAYELLPIRRYHPALGSYKRLPAASMMISRGCPGRCTFCFGGLLGSRWRFHSPARIIEDLIRLKTDYGVREISFYDDTFTANPHLTTLCEAMISNRLNLTWVAFARVDTVDKSMLHLMKRAGCHQLMYGLESADRKVLKLIRKRFEPQDVERAVKLTRQAGIDIRLAIMLGNPGETSESLKQTMAFVKRVNPDLLIANITTPYPGTEMYAWADSLGYLKSKNWDDYTLAQCVMELPTISCAEVEAAYRKVYREFYFRPAYLTRRLAKLTTIDGLLLHLRSLRAIISFGNARKGSEHEGRTLPVGISPTRR